MKRARGEVVKPVVEGEPDEEEVQQGCKHAKAYRRVPKEVAQALMRPELWACAFCGSTESVETCLGCGISHCHKHAKTHFARATEHPLSLDLETLHTRCHSCNFLVQVPSAMREHVDRVRAEQGNPAAIASRGKRKFEMNDLTLTALKRIQLFSLAKAFDQWRTAAAFRRTERNQRPREAPRTSARRRLEVADEEEQADQSQPPVILQAGHTGTLCFFFFFSILS